ncbi:endosome/lysosome-associated apoptosis and autophagy regulator family member 2-like isoform X2 [Mya arenaria]|uniref:endosome/lysosome-associated apoptosis and autophagy regulator family member 2-like isoform X2 n=1 Tax=Mya arenaria TaxID=6604 RepID=UPI0022E8D90D|nr:endosome/lysosome-associated apoptosis and autophagy regulator family member 2-like isoform X2 [Mya arenaria]
MKVSLFVLALLSIFNLAIPEDCDKSDYVYKYTQCDVNGDRWVVSVPKDGCQPRKDDITVPRKGTKCSFTCEKGTYLDIASQQCKHCPAGTYSRGSAAHFDDWDTLPNGFSASTESIAAYESDAPSNCSSSEWTPKSTYIAVTPSDCISKLTFSASLMKPGTVQFEYQYNYGDTVMFHVSVQNDQCQSANDQESSLWPDKTSGSWKSDSLKLKSGYNVITWSVFGYDTTESASPILLRKVHVTNVAYASDCAKCPAGSYSSEGSEFCSECPINTYSSKGAEVCERCDHDTQYAGYGSTECKTRPACSEEDYYHSMKPCEDGKTANVYTWIQPQICNPNLSGSIPLPPESEPIDCMACNSGMTLDPATKRCTYCPPNFYSDGTVCKPCGTNTAPDYSYSFMRWNSIPDVIGTACIPFTEKECSNDTKWLAFGDHIESHFARGESAYLVLQVKVAGFRTQHVMGEGESSSVGQLKMTFETQCEGFCQIVILSDDSGKEDVISAWEYQTKETNFVYNFKKNTSFTLSVAFQNSGWMLRDSLNNSTMKISSLEVTNTINGGASICHTCPKGKGQNGCIPCPDGQYIDVNTTSCVSCPPRTVVPSHNAYGVESCKPCGRGLTVFKGRSCISTGVFTDDLGRTFDLRNLTATYKFMQGSLLFTSSGTQYYHGFNISLFGEPDKSFVICENNVTQNASADFTSHFNAHPDQPDITSAINEPKRLVAKICRSTLVPASEDGKSVMTTQSTSLGDFLVEIVRNESVTTIPDSKWSTYTDIYNASGFDTAEVDNDIQVHFKTDSGTHACPNGRHTLISLRCDQDAKGQGEIKLPPSCPDATCNGCVFHFLWLTRAACPVCRKEDFDMVLGMCENGYQTVHYINSGKCLVPDSLQGIKEQKKCIMLLAALPIAFQIAIPSVLGLVLLCFFVACILWRKNQKLAYRYMKLVENSQTGEVELPGADSCALEEDEHEDGDSVAIRGGKGARFFKKLTNKIKKDDAFESAVLNERMPLT